MTSDASKNITAITYNHLNLPRTFTFSGGNTIEMTYDASGMKLAKIVKQGTTQVSRQDYVKGFEYHNSKLQAIYHSEGRVAYCDATQTQSIATPINGESKTFKAGLITAASTITGSSNVTMQAATSMTYLPGFQVEQGSTFLGNILPPPCVAATAYEYVIRDHLGNGRIYFVDYNGNGIVEEANGEILQEAHYDPWGYALGGSWVNNSSVDNLYQYNGKEVNNDIGLGLMDYGARWYDAGVGRWTTVDPLSEKMPRWSGYNYGFNNPIRFIDPDGREPNTVDPSRLNENGKAALVKLLSTAEGRSSIGAFANKGETISLNVGGKSFTHTFSEQGTRGKDILVLNSQSLDNVRGNGLTRAFTNEGYTQELSNVDKNTNIKGGVTILIDLDITLSEGTATNTLAHEVFTHLDQDANRLNQADKLKVGSTQYGKVINSVGNSAKSDHGKLARDQVLKYSTFSNCVNQCKQYEQDVQDHKKDIKN